MSNDNILKLWVIHGHNESELYKNVILKITKMSEKTSQLTYKL
jgi:hypothetical protein